MKLVILMLLASLATTSCNLIKKDDGEKNDQETEGIFSGWRTTDSAIAADGGPATLIDKHGRSVSAHNGGVLFSQDSQNTRELSATEKIQLLEVLSSEISNASPFKSDIEYFLAEMKMTPRSSNLFETWKTAKTAISADGGPATLLDEFERSVTAHNGAVSYTSIDPVTGEQTRTLSDQEKAQLEASLKKALASSTEFKSDIEYFLAEMK